MTNQTEAYRKPELELVGFDGDVILTSGPLPTCTTEIIECPNQYTCENENTCPNEYFDECNQECEDDPTMCAVFYG